MAEKEQELIKRGYIVYTNQKKEEKRKIINKNQKRYPFVKNLLPRDVLKGEPILGITGSQSCLPIMRKCQMTIRDWYSFPDA